MYPYIHFKTVVQLSVLMHIRDNPRSMRPPTKRGNTQQQSPLLNLRRLPTDNNHVLGGSSHVLHEDITDSQCYRCTLQCLNYFEEAYQLRISSKHRLTPRLRTALHFRIVSHERTKAMAANLTIKSYKTLGEASARFPHVE